MNLIDWNTGWIAKLRKSFLNEFTFLTCKNTSKYSKITRRERPKSAPYLRLKNIQGTTIGKIWNFFFKKNIFDFFSKKVFFKSHNAEKLKKRPFRLIQRFLQTENFKKMQGGTL